MKYLLDTCIIEALLKAESGHENIRDRIAAAPHGSLAISALTAEWMAEIGKLGGSVTSAAKAKAAAENGKLGGRPRKTTVGV